MTSDSDGGRIGGMIPLNRSHRYTWMLNGWTNAVHLGDIGGGTEFVTISVPDDFVAARVGFANINTSPWLVRKVIACASSSWNDGWNPVIGSGMPRPSEAWSTLTFQNGGADREALVTMAGAPGEVPVAGNTIDPASGDISNPRWTFTDWVPCASVGADPATGMRTLMLRALVPGNQTVTFTNGRMDAYSASPSINRSYRYFTGGLKFDTDLVMNPSPDALPGMTTATVDANHLVNGQMICLVQVLTRHAGIVGLVTGDSHQAGSATVSGINNFLAQSLLGIGQGTIGTVPVGVASTAAGGLSSEQFFPRMTALLEAIRPACVVLPGWSFNEHDDETHASAGAEDALFARMILAAEHVRMVGAVPIFVTPFPRDRASMTPVVTDVWLARREDIFAMREAGEYVFDATPLLGATENGRLTATYLEGLSSDAIHPNDAGHAILAKALTPFMRDLMGLRQVSPALPDPEEPPEVSLPFSGTPPASPSPIQDRRSHLLSRLRWHGA